MLIVRKTLSARGSHGGSEESYLASTSDLMIGLLFVFIVMVVVLSMQLTKGIPDPRSELIGAIDEGLRTRGLDLKVNPRSGTLSLPADVLFDQGSYQLKAGGVETLATIRSEINTAIKCYLSDNITNPQCQKINPQRALLETIYVEGHTDKAPVTKEGYNNWYLGLDRARSVYYSLINGEMANYRNTSGQPIFGFSSYADERPADPAQPDNFRLNRRVELRFVMAYRSRASSVSQALDIDSR